MTPNTVGITINNHKVEVPENITILAAARQHQIDIPAFCADPRLKPVGRCGICAVEIKGQTEPQLACKTKVIEGMEITTESPQIAETRKDILNDLLANHNAYCEPPCHYACPAGINIPAYIKAIADGDTAKCIAIVKERLPLPRVIGRVCPRPCQEACRHKQVDKNPIMICQLKRYAGDDVAAKKSARPEVIAPSTGKKVAIVGSGPSGLSAAYYLAKGGHDVTIYESGNEAGGMLKTALPSYRLPKDVVDDEVNDILNLGVKLKTNTALGKDISFDDLKNNNDALYLAIGAQKGSTFGLEGTEGKDFYSAVDYLAKVNANEWDQDLGKVVVIGGGFTAMDAARASARSGAKAVSVIYRRTEKEMPAHHELKDAQKENVNFKFLAAPISIIKNGDKVTGLKLQQMELGEPDESGRQRPVAIESAQFDVEADTIIMAIGQEVVTSGFGNVELNQNGTIKVDKLTLATNIDGVFAGGDCNRGPSTVVESIADGRRAGVAINAYLNSEDIIKVCENPLAGLERKAPKFFEIGCKPKSDEPRQYMPEIPVEERTDFTEIELGYTPEQAKAEAQRCLQCVCHEASVCKLQKYSIKYNAGTTEYKNEQGQFNPYDAKPMFILDRKRCIKCHNCVRICDEVQQQHVYKIGEDDYPALKDKNYDTSGCVFCGQCVSSCPTGALKDNTDRGILRKDLRKKKETTCPYCGVGCRFNVEVEADKVVAISNNLQTKGVNKGNLCVKGRFGFSFHDHPDRLKKPLIRESRDQEFREVSWEEALKFTAGHLTRIKDKYGSAALGILTSSRGLNEENYVAQKFYRSIIGTNNVDNCARVCHAPSVAGLYRAFGSGAATNSMADIKKADFLFVIGSNATEAHPIAGILIKEAISNGTKMIVADPRKIELAERADIFLRLKAGTNIALLNGILNVIVEEGLTDEDFISQRTENFELTKAIVAQYTPEKVQEITGVNAQLLRQAAIDYAKAKRAMIIYSLGITEHRSGSFGVMCLANLAMATGNVGRSGAGILVLRGQNNVQGSCDMGALPEYYTGYQRNDDEKSRQKFEKAWGTSLPLEAGLKEPQMYRAAIAGKFKSLHIIGYDPVKTQSNLNFVIDGYDNMDFVVVQDIFLTKTAQKANVVLPAACYFEKEGTFTNAERRVQRVRQVIKAPEGLKSDWEIICDIAKEMGADLHYDNASQIMDEVAKLTPQYNGVDYKRLENEELHWPIWNKEHEGTPMLHHTNFTKGKGTFHDIPYTPSVELPDEEYPVLLTTGRRLHHYCNGSMTLRTPILAISPEELLEIHPEDAQKYALVDGEMSIVESRRGQIKVKTKVTERSAPGIVFLSFHYEDVLTNLITGPGEDELSLTPEYKVCAVKIRHLAKA